MKGIKYLALAALCVIGLQTASFAWPGCGYNNYRPWHHHHHHHHYWW